MPKPAAASRACWPIRPPRGLKRGRLKIVLAKYEQPALPIHIVYPTSRLLSAKVRAFIDLVVETAEWRFG